MFLQKLPEMSCVGIGHVVIPKNMDMISRSTASIGVNHDDQRVVLGMPLNGF